MEIAIKIIEISIGIGVGIYFVITAIAHAVANYKRITGEYE